MRNSRRATIILSSFRGAGFSASALAQKAPMPNRSPKLMASIHGDKSAVRYTFNRGPSPLNSQTLQDVDVGAQSNESP